MQLLYWAPVPISVEHITAAQRDIILAKEEGHFADHKAIEAKPSDLSQDIASYANADGGELYIGIDEVGAAKTHKWRGFANQEAANAHLQVFEDLFPLGRDFQYTFLSCNGEPGVVLQIQILKTRDIKRATNKLPYVRRGAQKLPVTTPQALKQLEYTKGLTSFETEPVNVAAEIISNSEPIIEFMLQVVPTAEPDAWLRKQQLLLDARPTVAGILLFAEEPQAILPKRCGIKVYRYKTTEAAGFRDALAFDPITVEGCLYGQIRKAVDATVKVVEEAKTLGASDLATISYPQEAVHEIITNAVIHRDYSIADDVHIRIFDNRIEVESPGRLPAHVTIKNILEERFSRNGSIVRMLNRFPNAPNKDVGEGLNTAFDAMVKLGLKEPTITEKENSVLVTIRHERLASPEEAIIKYLEDHTDIRNAEARKLTHVSADYVMKKVFNRLIERGLIEQVPGTTKGATRYRMTAAATFSEVPLPGQTTATKPAPAKAIPAKLPPAKKRAAKPPRK